MSDNKDFDAYSNYDDRPKVEKTKSKTIDYSIQHTREEFAEEHHPAPQKNANSKMHLAKHRLRIKLMN